MSDNPHNPRFRRYFFFIYTLFLFDYNLISFKVIFYLFGCLYACFSGSYRSLLLIRLSCYSYINVIVITLLLLLQSLDLQITVFQMFNLSLYTTFY